MAATKHFKKWSKVEGGLHIKLDLARFDKQFQEAQFGLDSAVMSSMRPFMPKQEGTFIKVTEGASAAIAGSGVVFAAFGPQGRFLYEGKTMVSEVTGSTRARLGEKKVLVSQYSGKTKAKEDLVFNKKANPNAQAHWFDAAKAKDGKVWVKSAKKTAGGGKHA